MLSARKLHLVAGLKVQGLDLRKAELDFYMLRYNSVIGISSILVGLSYVGLIKIKIPEALQPETAEHNPFTWQVFSFYTTTTLTMCFALFNLVLTSFLVVNAQGLMLRGPPDSVQRCVDILAAHWFTVRFALMGSLAMLLASVVSICWMKLADSEWRPGPAVICSVVVGTVLTAAVWRMARMMSELAIPADAIVHGDLTVEQQAQRVDILSETQPSIAVARS